VKSKPVTISCEICHKVICVGEAFSWGGGEYDDYEGPSHDACLAKEREKEAAQHRAEMARLRAKEERIRRKEVAGEELTFEELQILTMADLGEAMAKNMFQQAVNMARLGGAPVVGPVEPEPD
jgi:hypothetical protein